MLSGHRSSPRRREVRENQPQRLQAHPSAPICSFRGEELLLRRQHSIELQQASDHLGPGCGISTDPSTVFVQQRLEYWQETSCLMGFGTHLWKTSGMPPRIEVKMTHPALDAHAVVVLLCLGPDFLNPLIVANILETLTPTPPPKQNNLGVPSTAGLQKQQ